ncbi:hypothetical protein [uncultured Nostoc sp.]|uniref:hypothetical protein n=1 Tax=uncultured Nostoc sp. TaxID=340711 RepID=UPI0035CC0375
MSLPDLKSQIYKLSVSDRLELLEARFDRLTSSDAKNQDQQLMLLTKQGEITVWFAPISKP